MAIGGLALFAGLAFLFGFFVMLLWNWLMPAIFGLGAITYWQAWGLVVLAHILFKSGHHNGKSRHSDDRWKKRFRARFEKSPPAGSGQETGEPEEGESKT
jgi:hypothetical protein